MAKGRFLSRSIATDKALSSLSTDGELVFLKTVPHLDRDGLILGDDTVLWAAVCPRRPEYLDRMTDFIQEWIDAGLVVAYDTVDGRVLFFPGFHKNQQGMRYDREAPSELQPPPGFVRTETGLVPDDDNSTPELLRTNSGVCSAQGQVQVQDQVQDQVQHQGQGGPNGLNDDDDPRQEALNALQVLGLLTKTDLERFNDLWPELSGRQGWVGAAVTVARDNNAYSPRYALAVLANAIHTGRPPGGKPTDDDRDDSYEALKKRYVPDDWSDIIAH